MFRITTKGGDCPLKVNQLEVALSLAMQLIRQGKEVDITSELTGEILLSFRDDSTPYIASAIAYVI